MPNTLLPSNSNIIEPIYYKGQRQNDVEQFKKTNEYKQFEMEYKAAIDKTIAFYLKNETNEAYKTEVNNNLHQLKETIFGNDDITFQHIMFPAQKLRMDDLFEYAQLQQKKIVQHVIERYVMKHSVEIQQRDGGGFLVFRHNINIVNAFINTFSAKFGLSKVNEIYISESFVTPADIKHIETQLRNILTIDRITSLLTDEYINKIKTIIERDKDGYIKNESIQTMLDDMSIQKRYGKHDMYSVAIIDEEYRIIGLQADPTAIKIEIARQLFRIQENKQNTSPSGLIKWPEEILLNGDKEPKTYRIGDLFWQKNNNDDITLPCLEDLSNCINEVSPRRLITLIESASQEDANILKKIDPLRLPQEATIEQFTILLSKLDKDGSIHNAKEYVIKHKKWSKSVGDKPIISIILKRLSDKALLLIPLSIVRNMTMEQIHTFFSKLDKDDNLNNAIEYSKKDFEFFGTLDPHPFIPLLLERLSAKKLAKVPSFILHSMTSEQSRRFYSKLIEGQAIYTYLKNNESSLRDMDRSEIMNFFNIVKDDPSRKLLLETIESKLDPDELVAYSDQLARLLMYTIVSKEIDKAKFLIEYEHTNRCKVFIDNSMDPLRGRSPLTEALRTNQLHIVSLLLNKHPLKDYTNHIPLYMKKFVMQNRVDILSVFIQNGADVNCTIWDEDKHRQQSLALPKNLLIFC